MPENDDFQLLGIVRATAQSRELKNPPKHHIRQREEHEASRVGSRPILRAGPDAPSTTRPAGRGHETWIKRTLHLPLDTASCRPRPTGIINGERPVSGLNSSHRP
jgi:hypothetical protein